MVSGGVTGSPTQIKCHIESFEWDEFKIIMNYSLREDALEDILTSCCMRRCAHGAAGLRRRPGTTDCAGGRAPPAPGAPASSDPRPSRWVSSTACNGSESDHLLSAKTPQYRCVWHWRRVGITSSQTCPRVQTPPVRQQ
jgi:hypothetical protein